LANATPYTAEIPYGRTKLVVLADDTLELTAEQVDDFRPGKPGSEEVKRLLNAFGCFLVDNDKNYDVQCLTALEAFVKEKNQQYQEFYAALVNSRINAGVKELGEDDLAPQVKRAGHDVTLDKIKAATKRIERLKNALTSSGELGHRTAPKYDMERTCFGVNPPKEFRTKLALEIFLEENPEVARAHQEFLSSIETETVDTVAEALTPTKRGPGRPKSTGVAVGEV
jgi:hypothetical protein